MTSKPPPDEDSPDPVRVTPKRVADQLHRLGEDLARLQLRARALAPFIDREHVELLHDTIRAASLRAVDLGSAVRVGQVPIVGHLDTEAGRGVRPIIDKIEDANRPQTAGFYRRKEEAVAAPPAPVVPPASNGQANGAPTPAKRKKGGKGAVKPSDPPDIDEEEEDDEDDSPVDLSKIFLAPGRPAGGEYTPDQLGIVETLDDLGKLNSCDTINPGRPGKRGTVRGAVKVQGHPYAVTGSIHKGGDTLGVTLTPLVFLDQWEGPRDGHVNPRSGYYGIEVKCKSYFYVLGHREQEIELKPAPADIPNGNIPAPGAWSGDDVDAELQRALAYHSAAWNRWLPLQERGATDAQLGLMIESEFGHGDPVFRHGKPGHTVRGGRRPAFWMGARNPREQPPLLEGAALVARVRLVMSVPEPAMEEVPA